MVLSNSLQVPPFENSFSRPALFTLLDSYFSRPLVSVVAGGGYGKTTLVADYLRTRNIPAIWFSGLKNNFSEMLSRGLSQLEPQLEVPSEDISLLEALAHWSQPLAIVLDDLHLVDSPELHDFILQLVGHAASTVTFVVISRQRPSFPYTKLKMQNRLAEVIEQQLEFSHAEIKQFFHQNGLELADHELELVKTRTSGWPASLPLIVEAWKGLNPEERRWNSKQFSFSDLFEELESELFTGPAASFLALTSVLHEWDEQILASYLTEQPNEWRDSRYKQRLFIRKNKAGKDVYLPLFRMYLYEKLLETKGKQELRKLHLKAAALYEADYQYYFAFAHYLAANHYRDAARIMQKMMNLYTPERFILLLDGSLETICPSISMVLFSHFLFRCVPISILNSYIVPLKTTLNHLKQQGLSAEKVFLEHRLGIILYYSGEIEDALTYFLSSYEGSQKLWLTDLVAVNQALVAQCCRFLGRLEEGTDLARKALTNIELGSAPDGRMHATWILAELLLEKNELTRAEPFVGELQRLANEYDEEGARVYPLIAIGKYYRLKGDWDSALTFTKQGMTEAEKFNLDTDLGWGCLELGLIYRLKAEHVLAQEYLQKSLEYFSHYRYFSEMVKQMLQPERKSEQAAVIEQTNKLSIKLLGNFQLEHQGRLITLKRKSSLLLLFLLAVRYSQKTPKDIILEELFPEGNYSSQNNRFYVSLSTLRKALEPELTSAKISKYIIQSGELFFLDQNECEIDLEKFQRLVATTDESSPENRIAALKEAVGLYHGDLLAEYPYESFLAPIRETIKQSYLQALRELGRFFWSVNDFTQGMRYYDQLINHDEYAEAIYWEYLDLLMNSGFKSYAMQIGQKMEKAIEGELGIPVKQKLLELYKNND